MRILLVDDETLARSSVRQKLSQMGGHTVEEAANGREGLEMAEKFRPDLIIADIRMPVLDGIGMLAELRARGDETFVVILSGYELFSYAREAMQYNASAYLLKPVDDTEFARTLASVERKVELMQTRERLEHERQTRLRQGEDAIRQQFLADLIFQRKTGRRYVSQRMRDLLPAFSSAENMIALFRVTASDAALPMELGLLLYGVENVAAEMLGEQGIACCGFVEQRDLVLMCNVDPARWTDSLETQTLFRSVKDVCRRTFTPHILLGLGLSTPRCEELYTSYARALRVVERQVAENADAAAQAQAQSSPLNAEREELLLRNLMLPDRAAVTEIIDTQFAPFIDGLRDEAALPGLCLQLILLFERAMAEGLDSANPTLPGDEFALYQQVTSLPSPVEMNLWMRRQSAACMDTLVQNQRESGHALIWQARQYIHAHYPEPITLEDVAQAIHLSPSYCSGLFREQAGVTMIKYLVDTRIAQAKRLLLDPSRRVSEVGTMVGFHDMKHFYKVFKKYTGLTPSEYRQRDGSV